MDNTLIYRQTGRDPMYKVWHTSKMHLILYVYSGTGSLVSAEKVFPLREGMLVFVPANAYHYTMPEMPEFYNRSKLFFSPRSFADITTPLQRGSPSVFSDQAILCAQIDKRDRHKVDEIFSELVKHEAGPAKDWLLAAHLMQLVYLLIQNATETAPASVSGMSRAIAYINENITSGIDIDEICNHIHISKYHFCRQFKKRTGLTVMKYITKTRIMLAKAELSTSALSIGEISDKLGFSSPSYFCRAFKEEEGCSPLQYRKAACVES